MEKRVVKKIVRKIIRFNKNYSPKVISTKKFLFFSSYYDDNSSYELCRLVGGKHYKCPKKWRSNQLNIIQDIKNCDIVIIWNGLEPCSYWIKNICEDLNKPYVFLEHGFVPQKNMLHLDPKGLIKQSSLNDNLDWVSEEIKRTSENYIDIFLKKSGWSDKGSDYILCPLQLPYDTSVYLCSKYHNMDDFIQDVIDLYPDEKIIVTPHPRLKQKECIINPTILNRIEINFNESTMELAQKAKEIIGITSTVLYETLALGKKTTALGQCPINTHNGDRTVVLGAIHRQFHIRDINRFYQILESILS